jgi:hypothetical protein
MSRHLQVPGSAVGSVAPLPTAAGAIERLGDLDELRADYVRTIDSNTLLAAIGSRSAKQYMHHS